MDTPVPVWRDSTALLRHTMDRKISAVRALRPLAAGSADDVTDDPPRAVWLTLQCYDFARFGLIGEAGAKNDQRVVALRHATQVFRETRGNHAATDYDAERLAHSIERSRPAGGWERCLEALAGSVPACLGITAIGHSEPVARHFLRRGRVWVLRQGVAADEQPEPSYR